MFTSITLEMIPRNDSQVACDRMWGGCLHIFSSTADIVSAPNPNLEMVPTLPLVGSTEVQRKRGLVQTRRPCTNGLGSQMYPHHGLLRSNKLKYRLHWPGIYKTHLQPMKRWRNVVDDRLVSVDLAGVGERPRRGEAAGNLRVGW